MNTTVTYTYKQVADLYTWGTLLPLRANEKKPVPAGTTGRTAGDPSPEMLHSWESHTGNFALRMDADVIGVDVDDYADKTGATTLAEMEARLGALPPTYITSRRRDPLRAGTRFFLRRATDAWRGAVGKDIDMIQRGHRYSLVWPSVVPDAGGESEYRWYDGNGQPVSLPPTKDQLAMLPEAWERELSGGAPSTVAAPADASTTAQFRADMECDSREICTAVSDTLRQWEQKFRRVTEGSHHDTMLKATRAVVRECAKGHPGFVEAIDSLAERWDEAGLGEARAGEFYSLVDSAVSKAAGEFQTYRPQHGSEHLCESSVVPVDESMLVRPQRSIVELNTDSPEDADDSWKDRLEEVPGKVGQVRKSFVNTQLIMENDTFLKYVGRDTMTGRVAWRKLPPWRTNRKDLLTREEWIVNDPDMVRVKQLLCSYFGGEHTALTRDTVTEALTSYAADHEFSPWQDYLDTLPEWDGTPRMETAIPTLRADTPERERLNRDILRNFFLGMMQRAYSPGSQLDSILVLQGGQGYRKTSWFRGLVPSAVFYKELTSVPDSSSAGKDEMIKAHSASVVVFDEIDKLRRQDEQAAMKAFLTQRIDTWRAPYGRMEESHPRQFVLGGTSNNDQFLLDTTGNRRYWILEVTSEIPGEVMTREHYEQMLAEARQRYLAGERLDYSADFEARADAMRAEYTSDPVGEAIDSWLANPVDPTEIGMGGKPRVVDTHLVSVPMLERYIPEIGALDVMKIKKYRDAVHDAMNSRADYRPVSAKQITVEGRRVKKAWQHVG